jgi:hypothetical protein
MDAKSQLALRSLGDARKEGKGRERRKKGEGNGYIF